MESIQSTAGFHGWKCQSYFKYVFGLCPTNDEQMVLAGEDCEVTSRGLYLVKTHSKFPFAMGPVDDESYSGDARATGSSDDDVKVQEAFKMAREYLKSVTRDSRDNISNQVDISSCRNKFIPGVLLVD